MKQFEKELEQLINKHCIENECDMPDFLLAQMIVGFIKGVSEPIKKTLDWHGCDSVCHPKKKTIIGKRVTVYDRYLFAVPVKGVVTGISIYDNSYQVNFDIDNPGGKNVVKRNGSYFHPEQCKLEPEDEN